MVITWSLLPKDFASSMAALTVRSWLAALLRSSGSRISLNISTSHIAGPSGRCLRKAPAVSPPLRPGDQDEQQKRSEEHTSELQTLMRNSYAVFCLKKKQ